MKANELRLGNWVICNGTAGKTISLHDTVGWITADCELGNLAPIPLTPEILKNTKIEQKGMNSFRHMPTGISLNCAYAVSYVHQLQNLFFAICGYELEINFS